MLRKNFYEPLKPHLDKLSDVLNRLGMSPIQLTLMGLLINVIGFILYIYGHIFLASLVVWFAAMFDMLDGPLARNSGRVSPFGAFLDSVVDRYSDMLIFGGLLVYFARMGEPQLVLLDLLVIAGATQTSYAKARGENFIKNCEVGWIQRPERIFIIVAGGLFGLLELALWVLAITTNITVFQRIAHTWRELEQGKK